MLEYFAPIAGVLLGRVLQELIRRARATHQIRIANAFQLSDPTTALKLIPARVITRPMAPTWQPLAAWALLESSMRRGDGEAILEAASVLLTVAPHAYGLGVRRAVEMYEEHAGTAFNVVDPPAFSWAPPRFGIGRFLYVLRPWMVYAFIAAVVGLLIAFNWDPKPYTGRNWFEMPKYPLEPIGSR